MKTSATAVVGRPTLRFDVSNSTEAIKHPHPLVLGDYSVHTSGPALARGEAEINRIGERLRADGRL